MTYFGDPSFTSCVIAFRPPLHVAARTLASTRLACFQSICLFGAPQTIEDKTTEVHRLREPTLFR